MSKSKYEVKVNDTTQVVDTLREVSELLGTKVTRAEVEAGMENVKEITDNGTANIVEQDGSTTQLTLHDPLENQKKAVEEDSAKEESTALMIVEEEDKATEEPINIEETKTTAEAAITKQEEQKIEEILDNNPTEDEKDTVSEYAEEHATEAGSKEEVEDEQAEADRQEKEDKPEDKQDLQTMLAKLRANNAKLEKDQPVKKGKKRGKKIVFNGTFPEVGDGTFETEKDLKRFYKQLTMAQLEEWLELEGLTYKKSDSDPINRMRACMAILYLHFPRQTTGKGKKKSKYAKYTTEDLIQMAIDNNIAVKDGGGDPRILRMYLVMNLRKAGILEG